MNIGVPGVALAMEALCNKPGAVGRRGDSAGGATRAALWGRLRGSGISVGELAARGCSVGKCGEVAGGGVL